MPKKPDPLAAFADVDAALDGLAVADPQKLTETVRTLLRAYYGSDKNREDVDWDDIQAAVSLGCEALGVDESKLVAMADLAQGGDGPSPN